MMGAHVLELVAAARRREARRRRHRLRLPEVHADAVLARTTSGTGTPRRRTRPTASRRSRCSSARRPTASSTGSTRVYLLPANLYGPRDNFDLETSHVVPALIRKMLAGDDAGRALGRRLADPRVPLRRGRRRRVRARRRALHGRRADQHRHRARRSRSASSPTTIAELTGLRGRDRLGHARCRTASRGGGSTPAGPAELLGFEAATPLREGLAAHDRLVPRARSRAARC